MKKRDFLTAKGFFAGNYDRKGGSKNREGANFPVFSPVCRRRRRGFPR
jgi:hypothetical protein